jgi:hypothetical protein
MLFCSHQARKGSYASHYIPFAKSVVFKLPSLFLIDLNDLIWYIAYFSLILQHFEAVI